MDRIAVTIPEAVRLTGLSRTGVYQLIRDGRLDSVKIRKRRLVKVSSIRRLFGEEEVTGT